MGKKVEKQSTPAAQETRPKTKLHRFDKLQKGQETQQKGEAESDITNHSTWKSSAVLYIGHLPYGFMEEQLKQYFQQFGEVVAVKLCRSKKSARSKGYGFVQFEYPEVAAIAANTMNNYMILGRVLRCHVLKPHQINPFTFRGMRNKAKFINWKKIFIQRHNKVTSFESQKRSSDELKVEVDKLLEHEEQRRQRLKQLRINYEFPGYKSILNPQ